MYQAKLSVYRVANYYLVSYLRSVLNLLGAIMFLLAFAFYKKIDNPITYIMAVTLALAFMGSLAVSLYLRVTRRKVIYVDERNITFDKLLNQLGARPLPSSKIVIKIADLETIEPDYLSTDAIFGVGSSGKAAPQYWRLFRIRMKNKSSFYINTLFISEKNEHRLNELLNTLK